jgi:hypothetical protein
LLQAAAADEIFIKVAAELADFDQLSRIRVGLAHLKQH